MNTASAMIARGSSSKVLGIIIGVYCTVYQDFASYRRIARILLSK